MGYFTTLAEAEEWLNVVREIYPGAWAGEAPGKSCAPAPLPLPPHKPNMHSDLSHVPRSLTYLPLRRPYRRRRASPLRLCALQLRRRRARCRPLQVTQPRLPRAPVEPKPTAPRAPGSRLARTVRIRG